MGLSLGLLKAIMTNPITVGLDENLSSRSIGLRQNVCRKFIGGLVQTGLGRICRKFGGGFYEL